MTSLSVNELESILENSGLNVDEKAVPKKRKKVSHACLPCRKAHVSCDEGRPCARCTKRGHPELCIDHYKPKKGSLGPTSFQPIQPKRNQVEQELDFFQIFKNTSTLPMDDPFATISLVPGPVPGDGQSLPSCFSQPNLQELEELFLPQLNNQHVCQSRGLSGCQDCVFKIENILPIPFDSLDSNSISGSLINDTNSANVSNIVNTPIFNNSFCSAPLSIPLTGPFDNVNSASSNSVSTAIPASTFHLFDHLHKVLADRKIEIPIASHIIYLVRKLIENTKKTQTKFSLIQFQEAMCNGFSATPTCIFSPSGLILDCNAAFCNLLSRQKDELYHFCIFSVLDMGSTLCILDMAHKVESKEIPGYGRCIFSLEPTNFKSCSLSLTTFSENGALWMVGQFIPI